MKKIKTNFLAITISLMMVLPVFINAFKAHSFTLSYCGEMEGFTCVFDGLVLIDHKLIVIE